MHLKGLNSCGAGFSLIELVSVIVILATIAALAAPRFVHHDATVPAQADQLGRIIRHAQALAMSQGRPLTVDVQSATSYAITDGATPTPSTIRDPSGQLQAFSLQNGVTLSGADLEFDSLGRPISGSNLVTNTLNWTLNGGSNTATVSVQAVTGFVSVTP
ncbi:MAG: prepilin-type N-terminal cleavage/methylation domain-containing protein [Thiogranum sp.]